MKNTSRLLVILLFGLISIQSYSQQKTAYMVADAHLDTQWDWDIQTTINQYLKNTLDDNFKLFNKYPAYKFNFEGAIKYMWFKEYYPEKYEQLKKYVASGQWNVCGSSLDATDIIVPSTESQFRNILIGQTFFKKEFNKKGNDIFLPDCFGFGYTLPTIAKHAGLIGFTTQKLSWGGILTPFKIGAWQGVDGSKILAAASAGGYGDKFNEDLSKRKELIDWTEEEGAKTDGKFPIAFRLYGTGDRGGSPEDRTVSWIEKSVTSDGPVKIKSAAAGDMFNDYISRIEEFPQYNGELTMTTHGTGCYTSRTMMKRWNRKNELLGDAAEKSSVIADWMGGIKYPQSELYNNWIRVIWHQFHDDLTGTSCVKAYTFSQNDEVVAQNKFSSILNSTVGSSARALDTKTVGTPVVIYNPLSIAREDVVEVNLNVAKKTNGVQVFNQAGVEVPSQIIESTDSQVKVIFNASVKSVGYEVYDVRLGKKSTLNNNMLTITNNSLENSVYKVSIDGNGDISSILDKENNNKEILASPVRLALLTNEPRFWASWEVGFKTVDTAPRAYVDGTPEISIVEQGPVRITLKVTRKKDKSTFVQYIKLTNSDTKKRVDIENDVNWRTLKTLLKAEFKLAVSNPEATYDLGLGVIRRPNNTKTLYEVPAQQWADITNTTNTYGVSILNDCKYGWDKPSDNTLRLSLIHSPEGTNNSYGFQGNQDQGNNKFTYSIYAHKYNALDARSTWEAAKLNQPLMAFEASKHEGAMGKSFSMLSIESSQVALKTFKKAESSDDYVLRFYETKGYAAKNIKVQFAANIIDAKELNAIEEEVGNATFSGNTLTLNMTAFQPKTFRVKLAAPSANLKAAETKTVELPYNTDVITDQANMTDGDFDGKSSTYVAELLPETLVADGIDFAVGPKKTGSKNAVKCAGNKIAIPSGFTKLYILAASSDLKGSAASFKVGGKTFNFNVPYFSNFVGQGTVYKVVDKDTIVTNNYFTKENIAWTGNHRHNGEKKVDDAYVFTYMFKYCIEVPKGAKELILPNNSNITVFAVTAANNASDDTKPAAEFRDIQKPEVLVAK